MLLNFVIAVVFNLTNRFRPDKLFFYLIYVVYLLVYIIKGIVLNVTGLNTDYIYFSVRINISPEDYISALNIVTFGHALIVVLLSHACPESLFSTRKQKIICLIT